MKKTIFTVIQLCLFCITQKVCAQSASPFDQNSNKIDTSHRTKSGTTTNKNYTNSNYQNANDTSGKMKNKGNPNGNSNYYYQNKNTRDTTKRIDSNPNSPNQNSDQRKKGGYRQNNSKTNRDSINK